MRIREIPESRLREEIEQALVSDDRLGGGQIQVILDDGVVRLVGTVSSWSAREHAGRLADTACDGRRRVLNRITVERHGRAAF